MSSRTDERAKYIHKRARELAQTGWHKSFSSVASALRSEGHLNVDEALNNPSEREELNRLCREASAALARRTGRTT